MSRKKLTVAITVKLDDDDLAALDRLVRERERETNVPLSRALVLRELMRERIRKRDSELPQRARA